MIWIASSKTSFLVMRPIYILTLNMSNLSLRLAHTTTMIYNRKTTQIAAITAAWFSGENFRNTVEKSIVLGATRNEFPNVRSFMLLHSHLILSSLGIHSSCNINIKAGLIKMWESLCFLIN